MTILSYDDAIAELAKLTASGKYTLQDLVDLGSRVSIATAADEIQGAVTLFYSGRVNGVSSDELIAEIMKQDADIRVIDKTQAGAFLRNH